MMKFEAIARAMTVKEVDKAISTKWSHIELKQFSLYINMEKQLYCLGNLQWIK